MKMVECFQKGLLKRTSPDIENALRSLELSKSNIEDADENMSIHRHRVVAISSYSSMMQFMGLISRLMIKKQRPLWILQEYQ